MNKPNFVLGTMTFGESVFGNDAAEMIVSSAVRVFSLTPNKTGSLSLIIKLCLLSSVKPFINSSLEVFNKSILA